MKNRQHKIIRWLGAILLLIHFYHPAMAQKHLSPHTDWKLAIQSYTFHKFTLMQTLDKVQELGIHYIEVYPGHPLGEGFGDLTFSPSLDAATQARVKAAAKKRGISIIATGVVVVEDAKEWESYFTFAKQMGMEYITAEPALADWDLVEGLVQQYNIQLAVHNHPKPSVYWHPDSLLQAISQRDQRIGSCADVGHWRREGLDPLACLKQLKGRIRSLHFKDIAHATGDEHEMPDTIWGTGILNVKAMLQELKAQNFKGTLAIEYENNWEHSVPDIKQNLDYYHQVLTDINNL